MVPLPPWHNMVSPLQILINCSVKGRMIRCLWKFIICMHVTSIYKLYKWCIFKLNSWTPLIRALNLKMLTVQCTTPHEIWNCCWYSTQMCNSKNFTIWLRLIIDCLLLFLALYCFARIAAEIAMHLEMNWASSSDIFQWHIQLNWRTSEGEGAISGLQLIAM